MKKAFHKYQNTKAFTLIELLVVVAIVGILATVVVVNLSNAQVKSRDARRKADINSIAKAAELYFIKHDSYLIPDTGCANTGQGEFNLKDTTTGTPPWGCNNSGLQYPESIANGFVADGEFTVAPIDPKNSGKSTYMYYTTATGKLFSAFAFLERPKDPDADGWDNDGLDCEPPRNQDGSLKTEVASFWISKNYRMGNGCW
jgi:prepilin-type N-terminal cleavage/methylation domain-containing protein